MNPVLSTRDSLALAVANSTSDFLIVLDERGVIRYANPAFSRVLLKGAPAEGHDLYRMVDPPSSERARGAVFSAMNGESDEPIHVELFHVEPGGLSRPVFYSLSRIEGGVAAVGRDKTADLELLGEIVQLNMQLEEKQAQLADANARLEVMAITDQITGLYNRHHFFEVVHHIFEEARRYHLPMCCFMLDADHFKNLNDTHGHMFGDLVLREISDRLRRNTRRSDILARYGGEEFVIVAPNTDVATASLLAERLRSCVERDPFTLGSVSAKVTISLGIAGTEVVTAGPFDELLVCADRALYRAKQGGRNQFRMHTAADADSTGPGGTQGGASPGPQQPVYERDKRVK